MASAQLFRALAGGALWGLAIPAPGVNVGAAMPIAAGAAPGLIEAMAKLARLRCDRDSALLLAAAGGALALVALPLGGMVGALAIDYPWAPRGLLLGAALGGVPALWRPAGKWDKPALTGAFAGFASMAVVDALQFDGPIRPLLMAAHHVAAPLPTPRASALAAVIAASAISAAILHACMPAVHRFFCDEPSAARGMLLGSLVATACALWPFVTAAGGPALPEPATAAAALALALPGFAATAALSRRRTPT